MGTDHAVHFEELAGASALPTDLPRWYGIQTRAKHEKKVTTELRQKGVTVLLPTVHEIRRWSDRRVAIDSPLFPCYTFVRAALTARLRLEILKTPGVFKFVGFNRGPEPIPDAQIEAIQTVLASNIPFSRVGFLNVGDKVRIRGGSLEGVEGVLVGRSGNHRLVISVDLIQQGVSVSLEGYDVERI